jgi:drug/metabolite transporter (DMT)-like permease
MQGLARITACLFVISSLFPLAAGLLTSDPPRWLGVADVVLAALLAGAALTLASRAGTRSEDADLASGYRLVRMVAYGIPWLLALFFLAGSRINWQVMVIGLAWRAFLLVMMAPHLTRRAGS